MSKLFRSLAGTSFPVILTLGTAAMAAGQETPVPVPVPDPEPQAEAQADIQAPVQETQDPVIVELSAVAGAEGSGEAILSPSPGDQAAAVIEVQGLFAPSRFKPSPSPEAAYPGAGEYFPAGFGPSGNLSRKRGSAGLSFCVSRSIVNRW